jgi:hypothetical protein
VNLVCVEQSGIMIIGVVNKKTAQSTMNKVLGSIVNYTLSGSEIKVKVYLDTSKRQMIVFSSSKPEGEVFSDLPKDGVFYPAIQNKNQKFTNNARLLVSYNFDAKVPQDKSTIGLHEFDQITSNLSKYFPAGNE